MGNLLFCASGPGQAEYLHDKRGKPVMQLRDSTSFSKLSMQVRACESAPPAGYRLSLFICS